MVDPVTINLTRLLENQQVTFRLFLDRNDHQERIVYDSFLGGSCYESEITWFMLRAVRTGDLAVDVGANIGLFTCLLATLVGPTGKVLAVEPDPTNLEKLRMNVALNMLENVEIISTPLWERAEPVTFYRCADSSGSGGLADPADFPGNVITQYERPEPISFDASTLEKELARFNRHCAFVKVDTEGADEFVLRGLGSYRPDYIVAEINPFAMLQFKSNDDVFRATMRRMGYDPFLLSPTDELAALVPDDSILTHGHNGWMVNNLLFSTLPAVAKAYPYVPRIVIPETAG
jgi:FkbM family methyltransferase